MISAVNGDFELGNIYCFRYRVKLNNPLMGTETIRHDIRKAQTLINRQVLN